MGGCDQANLKKVMEKIWPSLKFFESPEAHDETELVELLKGIPRCEDAIDTNINKWMAADSASPKNLTDNTLLQPLIKKPSRLKSEVITSPRVIQSSLCYT
ncbi:hypothetical protein PR048_013976 [Dryococelus australis]|uniref:Uncharacterized protein n=1 Tax=Dryococelus australis TaxID=614101 RepID=A0ABQ9HTP7_9NEOP|nr:hypothetical protein PR048_013976 [Dryococelus australis]